MNKLTLELKLMIGFLTVMSIVAIAAGLSGCGCHTTQDSVGTVTITTVTQSATTVQSIINNYNEGLVSQGNEPLTQGLKCTLYNVPNMPATPCIATASITGCNALSASVGYTNEGSWTYVGPINQPDQSGTLGFNLLPTALQPLYSSNFEVICTGYVVNPDYNYHEFTVASDDGSLLYVNGSLVVQNDGEHSLATVAGTKYLQAQVYSFEIEYFQGPGQVALILSEDGNVMDGTQFYH